MATVARVLLSGSTNGKGVKVAATGTPGTTVHTAASGTTTWDQIWLWAYNSSAAQVDLTIEFGGTTSPDNTIVTPIPPKVGGIVVIPGWVLNNSLVMGAFAGTTNVIVVYGYVDRIT